MFVTSQFVTSDHFVTYSQIVTISFKIVTISFKIVTGKIVTNLKMVKEVFSPDLHFAKTLVYQNRHFHFF